METNTAPPFAEADGAPAPAVTRAELGQRKAVIDEADAIMDEEAFASWWHGQVAQAKGEATRRFPPKTAPETLIATREASGDEMPDETPDAQGRPGDELHHAPLGTPRRRI